MLKEGVQKSENFNTSSPMSTRKFSNYLSSARQSLKSLKSFELPEFNIVELERIARNNGLMNKIEKQHINFARFLANSQGMLCLGVYLHKMETKPNFYKLCVGPLFRSEESALSFSKEPSSPLGLTTGERYDAVEGFAWLIDNFSVVCFSLAYSETSTYNANESKNIYKNTASSFVGFVTGMLLSPQWSNAGHIPRNWDEEIIAKIYEQTERSLVKVVGMNSSNKTTVVSDSLAPALHMMTVVIHLRMGVFNCGKPKRMAELFRLAVPLAKLLQGYSRFDGMLMSATLPSALQSLNTSACAADVSEVSSSGNLKDITSKTKFSKGSTITKWPNWLAPAILLLERLVCISSMTAPFVSDAQFARNWCASILSHFDRVVESWGPISTDVFPGYEDADLKLRLKPVPGVKAESPGLDFRIVRNRLYSSLKDKGYPSVEAFIKDMNAVANNAIDFFEPSHFKKNGDRNAVMKAFAQAKTRRANWTSLKSRFVVAVMTMIDQKPDRHIFRSTSLLGDGNLGAMSLIDICLKILKLKPFPMLLQSCMCLCSRLLRVRGVSERFIKNGGAEELLSIASRDSFPGMNKLVTSIMKKLTADSEATEKFVANEIRKCILTSCHGRGRSSNPSTSIQLRSLIETMAPLIFQSPEIFVSAIKTVARMFTYKIRGKKTPHISQFSLAADFRPKIQLTLRRGASVHNLVIPPREDGESSLGAEMLMANDEGFSVALGYTTHSGFGGSPGICSTTNDLYYCGRLLGKNLIPGSDGRCGPQNGPQCASCKRFQAKITKSNSLNILSDGVSSLVHSLLNRLLDLHSCKKSKVEEPIQLKTPVKTKKVPENVSKNCTPSIKTSMSTKNDAISTLDVSAFDVLQILKLLISVLESRPSVSEAVLDFVSSNDVLGIVPDVKNDVSPMAGDGSSTRLTPDNISKGKRVSNTLMKMKRVFPKTIIGFILRRLVPVKESIMAIDDTSVFEDDEYEKRQKCQKRVNHMFALLCNQTDALRSRIFNELVVYMKMKPKYWTLVPHPLKSSMTEGSTSLMCAKASWANLITFLIFSSIGDASNRGASRINASIARQLWNCGMPGALFQALLHTNVHEVGAMQATTAILKAIAHLTQTNVVGEVATYNLKNKKQDEKKDQDKKKDDPMYIDSSDGFWPSFDADSLDDLSDSSSDSLESDDGLGLRFGTVPSDAEDEEQELMDRILDTVGDTHGFIDDEIDDGHPSGITEFTVIDNNGSMRTVQWDDDVDVMEVDSYNGVPSAISTSSAESIDLDDVSSSSSDEGDHLMSSSDFSSDEMEAAAEMLMAEASDFSSENDETFVYESAHGESSTDADVDDQVIVAPDELASAAEAEIRRGISVNDDMDVRDIIMGDSGVLVIDEDGSEMTMRNLLDREDQRRNNAMRITTNTTESSAQSRTSAESRSERRRSQRSPLGSRRRSPISGSSPINASRRRSPLAEILADTTSSLAEIDSSTSGGGRVITSMSEIVIPINNSVENGADRLRMLQAGIQEAVQRASDTAQSGRTSGIGPALVHSISTSIIGSGSQNLSSLLNQNVDSVMNRIGQSSPRNGVPESDETRMGRLVDSLNNRGSSSSSRISPLQAAVRQAMNSAREAIEGNSGNSMPSEGVVRVMRFPFNPEMLESHSTRPHSRRGGLGIFRHSSSSSGPFQFGGTFRESNPFSSSIRSNNQQSSFHPLLPAIRSEERSNTIRSGLSGFLESMMRPQRNRNIDGETQCALFVAKSPEFHRMLFHSLKDEYFETTRREAGTSRSRSTSMMLKNNDSLSGRRSRTRSRSRSRANSISNSASNSNTQSPRTSAISTTPSTTVVTPITPSTPTASNRASSNTEGDTVATVLPVTTISSTVGDGVVSVTDTPMTESVTIETKSSTCASSDNSNNSNTIVSQATSDSASRSSNNSNTTQATVTATTTNSNTTQATVTATTTATTTPDVGTIPPGVDPEVFLSLPPSIQNELRMSHNPAPVMSNNDSSYDPATLAALPADIRAEVLANERLERARANQGNISSGETTSARFIESLDPSLRRDIFATATDGLLETLTEEMQAEARRVRADEGIIEPEDGGEAGGDAGGDAGDDAEDGGTGGNNDDEEVDLNDADVEERDNLQNNVVEVLRRRRIRDSNRHSSPSMFQRRRPHRGPMFLFGGVDARRSSLRSSSKALSIKRHFSLEAMREAEQLVAAKGNEVESVLRILYFTSQSPARESTVLQSVLLVLKNLSAHRGTRARIIEFQLALLKMPFSEQIDGKDRNLSGRHFPPQVLYGVGANGFHVSENREQSSSLIIRRILLILKNLTKMSKEILLYWLQSSVHLIDDKATAAVRGSFGSLFDKGKTTSGGNVDASRERVTPLERLLDILSLSSVKNNSNHLKLLMSVVKEIVRPLDRTNHIKDVPVISKKIAVEGETRSSANEEESESKVNEEESESKVNEEESESKVNEEESESKVNKEVKKQKKRRALVAPIISPGTLKCFVSVLALPECSDETFLHAAWVMERLGAQKRNRDALLHEMTRLCLTLIATTARNLHRLNRVLDQRTRHTAKLKRKAARKAAARSKSRTFTNKKRSELQSQPELYLAPIPSDTKCLRAVQVLLRICEGSDIDIETLRQKLRLSRLWTPLSDCLQKALSNDTWGFETISTTPKINDEKSVSLSTPIVNTSSESPVGSPDSSLANETPKHLTNALVSNVMLRFMPLIECFFCTHVSTGSNDVQNDSPTASTSNMNKSVSKPLSPKTTNMDASSTSDSHQLNTFVKTNAVLLNTLIKSNPNLLRDSLRAMVVDPNCRVFLDFENKRKFFRTKLRKLKGEREARRRTPPLELNVRREEIFTSSFQAINIRSAAEMRGKLNVSFAGEEGVDAGGLTREWFSVLAREIFNPNYALFISTGEGATMQPNPNSKINELHLQYFRVVGRIIGKAVVEGFLMEAYFSRSFYKHLLGLPVRSEDLEADDPEYYKSLMSLLEVDDIEAADLELYFSVETSFLGKMTEIELKPGGKKIPVTNDNVREYITLVSEYRQTKSIEKQIAWFKKGFYEVCDKSLISIFSEQELELLISGLPNIDVDDLRANTVYHGYSASSSTIRHFWSAVKEFSQEEKAAFLQFVTGTSKVPLGGFKKLQGMRGLTPFNIHRVSGISRLPTSHTCFNTLDLPEYTSKEMVLEKLRLSLLECSEGFGFA